MRRSLHVPIGTLAVLAFVYAGCDTGEPGAPGDGRALVDPTSAGAVGHAPLRRLSNREYTNALQDLFPSLHPTLPELPADVPVAGFENAVEAQKPSDVRIARYEAIANLYAEAATSTTAAVSEVVGCADWSTPERADACANELLDGAGRRIFRRPLTKDERGRMLLRFSAWRAAVDFEGAVRLTLSLLLQAPQFLYRPEPEPRGQAAGFAVPVEPYAMASRLSFFLWESIPDEALLDAASRDELRSEAQLSSQVDRMLDDPRARRVFWSFHRQWLGLDRILRDEHVVRTPEVDAAWSATTQRSANIETQLFVENTIAEGGTFRDLLTSRQAWVDREMARIYGVRPPDDPDAWARVTLPAGERSGLLTRVSFLAGLSHAGATSPPVRGNGIQLRLLCQLPVSPPPGADLSQPTAAPGQGPQTNRMLFEARTKPAACQSCHAGLNGFGFGLESYDAAGRYQTTDNGLPVDASGTIVGTDVDGPFVGGLALSDGLSRSAVVHHCATQALVRYALGRAPSDAERGAIEDLSKRFMKSGGDLRALMKDVVTSPSFRMRRVEGGP